MVVAEADTSARDGSHDFDFLMGKWKIRHRRLTKPLSGSFAWYEFDGEGEAMRVWGGGDNIDEIWGDAPQGRIRGMTLRLYDRKSKQWRLYWANMATGVLETPVVGEFKDRKGEFYDQESTTAERSSCGTSGQTSAGTRADGNKRSHPMGGKRGRRTGPWSSPVLSDGIGEVGPLVRERETLALCPLPSGTPNGLIGITGISTS